MCTYNKTRPPVEQEAWQILIVEDDQRLAELTREYLESNGLRVAIEGNGAVAAQRIIDEQPDLVILDLMLPGEDGLSICRRVRERYDGPILMLTARTDDSDQIQGLDLGADLGNSYELLLRIQNQATWGVYTTMPDAEQQDQAVTDEAQDPATQTEDQATSDELLKKRDQNQDQATSPRTEPETEDMAQDPAQATDQDQTAQDGDRLRKRDGNKDTATDTRTKKTNDTAADENLKADDNKNQASSSEKLSNETTGSIDISAEQKTVIKNTIVETNVKPVDIDIKVSVGVSVPKTIELHPLPTRVVEILPAYRDYVYFVLADGRIVIVQPDTYEVVYILVV